MCRGSPGTESPLPLTFSPPPVSWVCKAPQDPRAGQPHGEPQARAHTGGQAGGDQEGGPCRPEGTGSGQARGRCWARTPRGPPSTLPSQQGTNGQERRSCRLLEAEEVLMKASGQARGPGPAGGRGQPLKEKIGGPGVHFRLRAHCLCKGGPDASVLWNVKPRHHDTRKTGTSSQWKWQQTSSWKIERKAL